jgi:hypothetical protein
VDPAAKLDVLAGEFFIHFAAKMCTHFLSSR